MTLHKIAEFYTEWSAFIPTELQNFAPSPYLKTASNKIMIQIKLIGMSEVHLSKCNGS
jgi:hypothetical protein